MLTTLLLLAGLSAAAVDNATPTAAEPPRGETASALAESSKKAAAAEDPFDGAVEVFHYGFEPDEDRNFDRQPDGWIRRKGSDFPAYVEAAIDRDRGHGGKGQSLRFKANGGRVILYSKPVVIDPYHSYIFRGYIRTQLLENDAALISVSLLNHKRQRVQRFLTRPVTGTFKDWCQVTIGPIVPHDDVHFVVVGCHLVHGSRMDVRGSAWFDDLWMGELPLFGLESNFQTHFRERDSRAVITSQVDGLDPKHNYRLDLQVVDAEGHPVAATSYNPHPARVSAPSGERSSNPSADERPTKEKPIDWTLNPQPPGFYAVEAVLSRDSKPILTKRTAFAVMDSLSDVADQGEFGWTIKRSEDMTALRELAEIASQSGINWLKYPLWNSVSEASSNTPPQISGFFDDLTQRKITPVGLLNDPPHELRSQFARDWTGISEIFTVRTEFWRESIEKVIARYSSHVRYWQLGQEDDESFVGMSGRNLAETIARVKSEFDRIGRDARIGVHWNWETPLPRRGDVRGIFLSMSSRQRLAENELVRKLKSATGDVPERWVLIKPLPKTGFAPMERGSDLVKTMVEAKMGGADKIFVDDIFDEETGLLSRGGAPTLLFLPWRTTAMALQGADFIGSFLLPEGSRNYAFARKGEVAVIIWNNETVDEDLFLGEESVVTDVLGRRIRIPMPAPGERAKLRVGPSPLLVRHFPEPIARWMAAVSFEKGRLPSKTGKQREVIHGINTFRQGVNGQLRIVVPKDWKVEPTETRFALAAGEKFDIPITLELPSNTSQGHQRLVLDFAMSPYAFRVYRDYEVGLGDVVLSVVDSKLESGDLQVKQLIDNYTKPEERLNFECNLYIPLRKRMQRVVTKLSHGRDTQTYVIPDAESLRGQELQIRAEQIGGQRVLNLKFKVGENWDTKKNERAARPAQTPPRRPVRRAKHPLRRFRAHILSDQPGAATRFEREKAAAARFFWGFLRLKKKARSPQKNRPAPRKIILPDFARFDIRESRTASYNGAIERSGSEGQNRRRASRHLGGNGSPASLDCRSPRDVAAHWRPQGFAPVGARTCFPCATRVPVAPVSFYAPTSATIQHRDCPNCRSEIASSRSMLHFRAWLLVTACFVSVVSVKAPAAESIPPPFVPASPADAAIVNRVFANWKALQERTKSFHVEWNTRVVQKLRRTPTVEELRRAFWVEGDDRFRVEFSRVSGGQLNWDRMPRGQRTWNDADNRILEWPHDPAAPPLGVVRQAILRDDLDPEHAALFLAFRPLLPLMGLRAARFRVVTEHAIVDGVHCVKLERALPPMPVKNWTPVAEQCWVDPARDDVPLLFEKTQRRSVVWSVAIQYRPSRDVGWVPERWTCRYQLASLEAHCTATKLSVNESFPPKTFQLDFPAGTLVFDEASHAQFLVAHDGSRAPPSPFDFVRSAKFRRALGTTTPFTIDPEPFGAALGFLSQAFNIPIEIDKAAVRVAAIDPNFDVHCDIAGLTGIELIRWISAQCPKPIALVEQGGKLVLQPLAGSKTPSPGNPPRSPQKNGP